MTIVLCGGRFNFPHEGHKYFLIKAKSHGDYLIVVVAHDSQNLKKSDGKGMLERRSGVENMGIADNVVIGDECDFFKVVEKYKPDVIALGWDQKLPFTESRLEKLGITVVKIDKMEL